MLQFAENSVLKAILNTESFGELKLLVFISLFLPLFLFVVQHARRLIGHQTNITKERARPHAPTTRKKNISTTVGPNRKPITRPRGPTQITVAEAVGFPVHEHKTQNDLGAIPSQTRSITIGDVLGLMRKKKDRTDKKNRKWRVSLIYAVSKMAVLSLCGGDRASGKGSEGKPLSSLMKDMDRAEKTRKNKLVVPMGVVGKDPGKGVDDGVCRVCRERSTDAAFVPCGHTYCRVCSREIWINRRSCPICRCRIVEVLDSF